MFNTIYIIERNSRVYQLHWKYRFGPLAVALPALSGTVASAAIPAVAAAAVPAATSSLLPTLAIGAAVGGTAMGISGTLQQGRTAEELGKARAEADRANAIAAEETAFERAKLVKQESKRLIKTGQAKSFASGTKGLPTSVIADIRAEAAKDISFIMKGGRTTGSFLRHRAAFSEASGKAARKQSVWSGISQGISGFGSIAMMGKQAGWFNKGRIPV